MYRITFFSEVSPLKYFSSYPLPSSLGKWQKPGPGTKEYGALSLAVRYYAKPYLVANVPPNCFMPRPKVGSAVVRLTRNAEPPVETEDDRFLFRLIRASFNQRRKTLFNGLRNSAELDIPKEVIAESIEELGKGANVRGEALSLQEFALLGNSILQKMHRLADGPEEK